MKVFMLTVLAIFVGCGSALPPTLDPCRASIWLKDRPGVGTAANEKFEYVVQPTCDKGTVRWDYPEGTMTLHFKRDNDFSLCIIKNYTFGYIKRMYDVTDKRSEDLDLEGDGSMACVRSSQGRADIAFSFEQVIYVGEFEYEVQPFAAFF